MARRLAQSIWKGWPAAEVSRLEALGATGRIARQIEDWSSARSAGAPDRPGPGPGPRAGRAGAGAQALGTAAVVRLLLHNAVRVDEACAAGIAGLGGDCGHRVIRVARKGARKVKIPLAAATVAALDAYLADRAHSAGVPGWWQLTGSLLATAGGRLRQGRFWELVRCLARIAGIGAWEQLSPRCLRHLAITFALDAGVSLRDVQDYASRKDPAPPAGMITPATAWTATPPIPSPPTWRSSIAELLGSAPAR